MLRAMPRHGLVGVFVTLAILFCFLPGGNAQIDRGSLTGLVTDPTGAAVPGARIIVTEEATQVSFETTTGPTGMYVFPALKGGVYTLAVEMTGFERFVRRGIDIHVQERVGVDVSLTLGAVTTEVVVTGAAPLLDAQTAQMGKVVGTRETTELPLLNRKYADLAMLSTGVWEPTASAKSRGDSFFTANGNWSTMNQFLLDGVDNSSASTNLHERSAQQVQPSVEALAEFRVQTRTYDAEFGRNSGAVVNATLKSGTNDIHGTVYEFFRNDKLQANQWALNRIGEPKPGFKQNQFGFSLGGPFPYSRDRTFWFFNFEGTRMHRGQALTGSVPTPLMRTGDFTESPYAINSPDPALVPSKAGCITGKVIDPACLDPVSMALLELYPLPNFRRELEGIPGSYIGNNYISAPTWTEHSESVSGRVDHSFGNDHLFGHYSLWDIRRLKPAVFYDFSVVADGGGHITSGHNLDRGQHLALNWTHTFSPRVVNEFRGGYNRMSAHLLPAAFWERGVAERFGLKGIPADNSWIGGALPDIYPSGWTTLGPGGVMPNWQVTWTYQVQDMVSVIFGNHNMKFGVEIRKDNVNFVDASAPKGAMRFYGSYTAGRRFGGSDFLLGLVDRAQMNSMTTIRTYWKAFSWFWQDQWRATPKLSLNYGVRYEYFTPMSERANGIANFDPTAAGMVVLAKKSGSTFDQTTLKPDRNNFAPRFGLAYSITPKLALRAGFGIFYQHQVRYGQEGHLAMNLPFNVAVRQEYTWPNIGPPFFIMEDGFPAGFLDPANVDLSETRFRARPPDTRATYVEQGSLNLQYEFAPNFLFDVGYVANAGHKVQEQRNLNQGYIVEWGVGPVIFPYPDFQWIQYMTTSANTNYHSLQVKLEKRYSRGLAFTAAWTWGHLLGGTGGSFGGGFERPQYIYDMGDQYGPPNMDVRHRFVLSYIYELPVGKGKNWEPTGVLGALAGGWQANGIIAVESGRPLTIYGGPDNSGTGPAHGYGPAIVGDPYPPGFVKSEDEWFNTAAFAPPAPFTFGHTGLGLARGQGMANFSFSVFKRFSITETSSLEFRAEVFNPFNSVRFADPSSSGRRVGTSSFGKILSRLGDPREFQLALKFTF